VNLGTPAGAPAPGAPIALSICIATFKRAAFIGQTLASIVPQLRPGVELLVLDGNSPDETPEIVGTFLRQSPHIVYRREPTNSGFDADYDKAVGYARGTHCWLLTDDDLLVEGAVDQVLLALQDAPDVVVVNAQVRNKDFSILLHPRMLPIDTDRTWGADGNEDFFATACSHLSFIGALIVRRSLWMERAREPYYGSMFVHMGVIFQAPLAGTIRALARPLVIIRYGNAMWTPRSFEVWMYLWPKLIWSFVQFRETVRHRITVRHPTCSAKRMIWFRAIGAFGPREYADLLARDTNPRARSLARFVMGVPAWAANAALAVYCLFSTDAFARLKLFELARAPGSTRVTRMLAGLRGVRRG